MEASGPEESLINLSRHSMKVTSQNSAGMDDMDRTSDVAKEYLGDPRYGYLRINTRKKTDYGYLIYLDYEKVGGSTSGIYFVYDSGSRTYSVGHQGESTNFTVKETDDREAAVRDFKNTLDRIPRSRMKPIVNRYLDRPDLDEALEYARDTLIKTRIRNGMYGRDFPHGMLEDDLATLEDCLSEAYKIRKQGQ